jgi:hypothetical protein
MMTDNLILNPSNWRKPNFRSGDDASATYIWQCPSCGKDVKQSYGKVLKEYGGIGDSPFTKEDIATFSEIFDIGYVGKSHDGGWPCFTKATCPGCSVRFVVYAGVQEPSNSFYIITIQGISTLD